MSKNTDKLLSGGTANVAYISESEGIAAMTGTLKGGAYAHVTSDHRDVGNGRFEFDMEDFFIYTDGSTIVANDKSCVQEAAEEITAGSTDYTVVNATGRFAGFTGPFGRRGGRFFDKGIGVLRFEGELNR